MGIVTFYSRAAAAMFLVRRSYIFKSSAINYASVVRPDVLAFDTLASPPLLLILDPILSTTETTTTTGFAVSSLHSFRNGVSLSMYVRYVRAGSSDLSADSGLHTLTTLLPANV